MDSACSKQHPPEYIARREMQLDLLDSLNSEERALIHEYGFDRALLAIRQFYGQPAKARAHLEAEREALQSARWKNIRI